MVTGTLASTIGTYALWAYLGTTAFSALATHLRYNSARNVLLRDGCRPTTSNRTFSERFSDFISDNWFLPLPILNFVKTIKLLKKNRFEYARKDRKTELINRGVLRDKEKPKEVPQEQPQNNQRREQTANRGRGNTRAIGLTPEEQLQQAQQQTQTRSRLEVNGLSVEEEIAIYRRRYNARVAEYRAMPSSTPRERLDEMYNEILELRELYNRAVQRRNRASQLEELRAQRAQILESYNQDQGFGLTLK